MQTCSCIVACFLRSHFLSLLFIHLFFFSYVVFNGEELLTFSSYCRVEFLVILS